jgi:hypothetical protein
MLTKCNLVVILFFASHHFFPLFVAIVLLRLLLVHVLRSSPNQLRIVVVKNQSPGNSLLRRDRLRTHVRRPSRLLVNAIAPNNLLSEHSSQN